MSLAAERRDDVMSVSEAAGVLGVKPATIYAYISRGLLASKRLSEDRRSWLSRAEVDAFARRRGVRPVARPETVREPTRSATTATEPTTSTQVGGIVGNRLLYRGRDATELVKSGTYGEVAELLWTGEPGGPNRLRLPEQPVLDLLRRVQGTMPTASLPLDRLKATAILLGSSDPFRYDLSPSAVISIARTLAPAFVESLPDRATAVEEQHTRDGLAAQLWSKLSDAEPSAAQLSLLSGALIVLAEHGVGPSTRAAGEAAASEADPYSVVLAGTSVASGLLLGGGSSLAVQAWLEEIDSVTEVSRVLADRLVRGDRVSGFGQPRYPDADPRAATMLTLLADSSGDEDRQRIVREVVDLVWSRRNLAPNAEFALGAMCFVHRMPRGAGEAVFVIARSAGWIAHAVEEYQAVPATGAPLTRG